MLFAIIRFYSIKHAIIRYYTWTHMGGRESESALWTQDFGPWTTIDHTGTQ
ncbi:MAG: hypothetical protein JWM99_2739 [Verrucomicrobiales bacterium]|nr:hypothetical protein [Verrucomicrobiales bacterium]